MSMPPDLSRRDFLNAAAGVGGGLILTLTVPGFGGQPKPGKPAGVAQLNAWLVIAADESVTVIVDRSEMGQGVYTALPMLLAEELEISLDAIKIVAAPVGDAYINPLNGGQITGTSNSVQDAWEKLRTAGAQARTMLILAAARQWKLEPGDCQAKNGRIVSTRGNTLTYGQLAAAAARQSVPKEVKLKPKGNFQLIGTSQARTDIPGKVDGTAQFGIDVTLPGMLYAALAQSPVLGGKVRSVDSAAAQAMPGVRKVLTTDSGVVVVAERYWQALEARKALDITWDPGTNARLDNAAIRALLDKAAAASSGLVARSDGNLAAAFKSAQHVLIAVYRLPLLAHATMEPMNCTADVKADGCDLYVGTQVQQISQATAASAAGLAPAQVRVHTTLLGGGFGRRLEVDYIPAAVQASKAVAAPVKLIWTREDDMTHDLYRPPAREELSAGLDAGGNIVAWRLHVTSPSITSRFAPQGTDPFDSVLEAAVNNLYGVPNLLVSYSRQEIGIDVGYMRSVSHAANCFAIESFMDELAGAAGQNPYDFRLKALHLKPRAANVLRLAAQRAGWGRPPQGRYQGIALMEAYATNMSMVAEISIADEAVKVHKIVCVVDCGQMINPRIVESQIESGIIFGLTAALWGEVTIVAGRVQQTNFNNYRMLRAGESPEIDVHLVPSDEAPGGIGEPAAAVVAPAVCNAIFAATGQRLRELPISAFKLRPGAARA
jgi:isoquinoline 1-oxidoreductase subunit beta